MITIAISHIIYLNKQERYDLYHEKEITKIGFFVPVCFYKGKTSEPAHEIFCEYNLSNYKKFQSIKKHQNGFKINIYSDSENDNHLSNTKNLLDAKDGGFEEFQFKEKGEIYINNNLYAVIHTVIILDESILIKSMDDI